MIGILSKFFQTIFFLESGFILTFLLNCSWLQFIYSDRNVDLLHQYNSINRLHPDAYLPPCLQPYSDQIVNKLKTKNPSSCLYMTNNFTQKMKMKHNIKLNSVGENRHWLLDYILIKDKDIYEHRGNDAFQYLLFQRYIIYFLTALTTVCIIILVPVNIYGKNGKVQNVCPYQHSR